MWWKVIPSMVIVVGFYAIARNLPYVCNSLFFGTPYRRKLQDKEDFVYHLRDLRLGGHRKQLGLESLDSH